jgi:hypothetical protein
MQHTSKQAVSAAAAAAINPIIGAYRVSHSYLSLTTEPYSSRSAEPCVMRVIHM